MVLFSLKIGNSQPLILVRYLLVAECESRAQSKRYMFLSVLFYFILRLDAHIGATILQITLQQDWSTLGMKNGRQDDVTSIFINVGHDGITNMELDMFALKKIQLKRW